MSQLFITFTIYDCLWFEYIYKTRKQDITLIENFDPTNIR